MPIPRIIHQIWFQLNGGPVTPPAEYDEMRASWRRLHPGWVFMDWNLEKSRQLLLDHYPEYLELFDGYKRDIFRIDSIRYFILHHYGGFYVDTDCLANQAITELCDHKVVLALNKYTKDAMGIYNNHFMGGIPGSRFFKTCVERLPTSSLLQTEGSSYVSVMSTAGPFYLTTIAAYHRKKGEVYTLPHHREVLLFTHFEKHSWKLAQNVVSDVVLVGLVAGGMAMTGMAVKEAYRQGVALMERKLAERKLEKRKRMGRLR